MKLPELKSRNVQTFFFILAGGIVIGLVISAKLDLNPSVISQPEKSAPAVSPSNGSNLITAVEFVADTVGPAVVSVYTEQVETFQPRSFGSPFQDEFFNRFFEDFFGKIPEREFRRSGVGSGVIIDEEGYILTNEHVVRDADTINVTLADGRQFKGELKGTDPRSDLAIIKIGASDLPVAQLGDSDVIRTGQWVVAIGNPFAHLMANPEPTVTTGVVSALHRSLPRTSRRDTDYTDLIQTDAAINPGNSGGPLVNLEGEIVGINVAIFSTTGGYQGIGFAIPVNNAKRIIEQLIKGKKVAYGWIGVSVQDLDHNLAEYFELPGPDGVLVAKVLEDGPAKKAGIQEGDVILSVNGEKTKNVPILLRQIGNSPIGKKIPLEILRDKKRMTVPVTIASRPTFDEEGQIIEETPEKKPEEKAKEDETLEWRGLTLQNITAEIKSRLRTETDIEGVLVTQITKEGPARESGLRVGDIIVSVNNKPVKSLDDFKKITKGFEGNSLIRTLRGFLVLKAQ